MFEKITLIGVGLIGGSFALALKKKNAVKKIVGIDRSADVLQRAKALNIIDEGTQNIPDAVKEADLILLAVPVAQTENVLSEILPHVSPKTIITDAGSTKSNVVSTARKVLGRRIAKFIPAHPIAGSEHNGPEAAKPDLFVGKKTVITPLSENSAENCETVAKAWQACGAIIHTLTPKEHDDVFAVVSHLPHLLAYALVDDVAQKPNADLLFEYAASGFRDFTRIAGSSPEMWRDISLANRERLLPFLDDYISHIQKMREQLAQKDISSLYATYQRAQKARQNWINTIEATEKS